MTLDNKIKRISLKNVSKTFLIKSKRRKPVLKSVVNFFSNNSFRPKKLKALDNVSFDIYSNESVGIIGDNGSGKSTLLRVIAGIYESDEGSVKTEGSLIYIDGFGKGIEPRMTMRENIFLVGSLLGLTIKEIEYRFNDIVSFSELEDHLDQKVYQFSNGMLTRLVFSITFFCAKHKKPDILIIDEVLSSGGDISFRKKAGKKIDELINAGTTTLVVSHNINHLQKYCNKLILIEDGKITKIGSVKDVLDKYLDRDNYTN